MKKYSINPEIIQENFSDDEIMLYIPSTGEIHILNQSSAFILSSIMEEKSISLCKAKFVSTIKNNYENYGNLENDFDEMINMFLEKSILFETN